MGPSAALPDAEAARKLSNTAGNAFWAEFWGIHEQLIDFAAIAAAHEDIFKAEAAHQAPTRAMGQPAPAAAAAAGGMVARAAAAQLHRSEGEGEEAASWAEIILQCVRPTGAPAPAPASALAGAAGGVKALVGHPHGRQAAQGSLSLGGAPGKPSAGPALDGWQLGAFRPGAIGMRLSASEAAEAVDVGKMPVSCSASLSVDLAGTSYAEQLKLASAAAAAGWTSWSSQQRPASQSERLLARATGPRRARCPRSARPPAGGCCPPAPAARARSRALAVPLAGWWGWGLCAEARGWALQGLGRCVCIVASKRVVAPQGP
jgi:hypothetical protein